MRSRFYWCRMGRCIAEVVWREDGAPICFLGGSGTGNVCEEPDANFVPLPLEPLWWHIAYWFNKLKRGIAGPMLKEFNENTRAVWKNKEWRTFIIFSYLFALVGYLIQKGFEALFGRFYLRNQG